MARPRSDDKRSALLDAAVRVIVKQGLSAPTAVIAKEAGVASGSLFTYFETKADLFNQLYLELKRGMASAALDKMPAQADLREQFLHAWTRWMRWALKNPEKRRALAQLAMFDELTAETRNTGHHTMAELAALMQRARAKGPMADAPFAFVGGLMNAMAEATMDFIAQDPRNAEKHSRVGFDALWRMLA